MDTDTKMNPVYLITPEHCDIVDEILSRWDIQSHKIDEGVLTDIKAAIEEAYLVGAFHGGIDKDLFHDAEEFVQKLH